MNRGVSVMWVGLMIMGAVTTYAMKDSAGTAADRVHKLRADIDAEKEAINLLRAEWSVVDQPARLQELVARYADYLKLQPLDVRQLATIADVPDKPPVPQPELDPLRTSSIKPAKPVAEAQASAVPDAAAPAMPVTGAQP